MTQNNKKLTENLLLAMAPAVGYFLTYSFEYGYCSYFNIPSALISIDFINVIYVTITLLTISYISFICFQVFAVAYLSRIPTAIKLTLLEASVWSLLVLLISYPLKVSMQWTLLLISIVFIVYFVLPILTFRKTVGYLNKIQKQVALGSNRQEQIENKIYDSKVFLLISTFITLNSLFYWGGQVFAKNNDEFITSKIDPSIVFIKIYDNHLIGKKFDRTTNSLTNELVIEPISENQFTIEKIKKLTP